MSEIAEAMEAVVGSAELRSRLRSLGLARSAEFSWEKTGQATAITIKRYI